MRSFLTKHKILYAPLCAFISRAIYLSQNFSTAVPSPCHGIRDDPRHLSLDVAKVLRFLSLKLTGFIQGLLTHFVIRRYLIIGIPQYIHPQGLSDSETVERRCAPVFYTTASGPFVWPCDVSSSVGFALSASLNENALSPSAYRET